MVLKSIFLLTIINSLCLISSGYITFTKNGLIRGLKKTLSDDHAMYAYLGIPFAKPPLGKLRFKPPEPAPKWINIRDTTTQKPQCVQQRATYVRMDKIEGSEDCLYLNVYTPKQPNNTNSKTYPVMVWIHGGGFLEGDNGYELYPPDNFVKEDIVVVTISYRLGIFGFLCTGDLAAPGNNGLRDQIMALKWVNENIGYFGGDKNSITIWGESAGGISISHLLTSPLSKGLFQKVIIESGCSIMPIGLRLDEPVFAFATGSLLNINTTDSEELVRNLQKIDYRELQTASLRAVVIQDQHIVAYTVVIEPEHENAVVKKSPYELLEDGEFPKIPILMGYNSNEGDGLPPDILKKIIIDSDFAPSSLIPIGLNLTTPNDANTIDIVGTLIKKHYFPGDTTNFTDEHFMNWFGDMTMIRPVIQQGLLLSNHTDVYFYEFNCVGYLGNPQRTNWNGAGHAEELNYLFKRRTQPRILSDDDKICSERVVKLWRNFVKYGNPTPTKDSFLQEIVWPKTAPTPNMRYLHFDKNLTVRNNPDQDDFQFWTYIFNTYGNRPFIMY